MESNTYKATLARWNLIKIYKPFIQLLLVIGAASLNLACSRQILSNRMGNVFSSETITEPINPPNFSEQNIDQLLQSLLTDLDKQDGDARINTLKDLVIHQRIHRSIIGQAGPHDPEIDYMTISTEEKLYIINEVCKRLPSCFQELLSDIYTPLDCNAFVSSVYRGVYNKVTGTTPEATPNQRVMDLLFEATQKHYPDIVAQLLKCDKIDHNKQDQYGKTAAMYAFELSNQVVIQLYITAMLIPRKCSDDPLIQEIHKDAYKEAGISDNQIVNYLKPVDKKGRNLAYYIIKSSNKANGIMDKDVKAIFSTIGRRHYHYINIIDNGQCTPLSYAAQCIQDEETYLKLATFLQHNGADPILALFLAVEQKDRNVWPRLVKGALAGLAETTPDHLVHSFLLNRYYNRYEGLSKAKFSCTKCASRSPKFNDYPRVSPARLLTINRLKEKIPELLDTLVQDAKENGYINNLVELLNELFSEYTVKDRSKELHEIINPWIYRYLYYFGPNVLKEMEERHRAYACCEVSPDRLRGVELNEQEGIKACLDYFNDKNI